MDRGAWRALVQGVRQDFGTGQQLEADVILHPESRLPWGPVRARGAVSEPGVWVQEGRETDHIQRGEEDQAPGWPPLPV